MNGGCLWAQAVRATMGGSLMVSDSIPSPPSWTSSPLSPSDRCEWINPFALRSSNVASVVFSPTGISPKKSSACDCQLDPGLSQSDSYTAIVTSFRTWTLEFVGCCTLPLHPGPESKANKFSLGKAESFSVVSTSASVPLESEDSILPGVSPLASRLAATSFGVTRGDVYRTLNMP